MTTTIVASGFTSTGLTAGASEEIDILPGGATVSTTVNNGGVENVSGTANYTTVSSGGNQVIFDGGGANGTRVSSGGMETVSGGVATFTAVYSGGFEYVGDDAITSGDSILFSGQQDVAGGGLVINTQVYSGGVEILSSGATATGTAISGGGVAIVYSGGTANGVVVNSGGTLAFFSGASVSGTVLLSGGTIGLADVRFDSAGSVDFNSTTDILTIHEGGKDYVEHLSGDYSGEYFHLANGGIGGTLVTADDVPCYCRGTRILTDHGEIAVENLRIGDRLITASGAARPIRWIGMRSYSGRFAAGNKTVLPILIERGALAGNVPKRDLSVSPLHAMYLDGVLIPAHALVNGVSITQATVVDEIVYFHLELASHDVIVAEGALAESFLDDGCRGMFHNASTYREMYPFAVPAPIRYCAPRLEDGAIVQRVRDRIAARSVDRFAAA